MRVNESRGETILNVEELEVSYDVRTGAGVMRRPRKLRAVDGVSLTLRRGESLGIAGESGCGKSSLARGILQLTPATMTRFTFFGRRLNTNTKYTKRLFRQRMQIVFQDPFASLDPRMTLFESVREPLAVLRSGVSSNERDKRARELLYRVGIPALLHSRYPHELSGGQCQRVGIARALVVEPDILVCDESFSALDPPIQAEIVELLRRLRREFNLALIVISHDIALLHRICDRIAVMYLGRVMESGPAEQICKRPRHPYTRALISAVPDAALILYRGIKPTALPGEPPSPLDPPSGCRFRTRCPHRADVCTTQIPDDVSVGAQHYAACHFARTLDVPS